MSGKREEVSQHCGKVGEHSHTVPMPIAGRVRCVDQCIAHLVAALNAGGIETVASCCGHGDAPGSIILADGRELIVVPELSAGRRKHVFAWLQQAGALDQESEASHEQ